MDYIQAITIAIIQGITEWFPISSSAHLSIVSRLANVDPNLGYFALLHIATVISLLIYMRKGALNYLWNSKTKNIKINTTYLMIASVPIFVMGFFLHDIIEMLFSNMRLIGVFLLINAIVLILTNIKFHAERFTNVEIEFMNTREVNYLKSFIIGLFQMIAIFPGISRTGMTVLGATVAKMKNPDTHNREMLMFVLMLSIPAVLGAGAYTLMKSIATSSLTFSMPMFVGFVVCIIVGVASVHILTHMIKKNWVWHWWFYSMVLGIILLFN